MKYGTVRKWYNFGGKAVFFSNFQTTEEFVSLLIPTGLVHKDSLMKRVE